jgi:hypothetical protein
VDPALVVPDHGEASTTVQDRSVLVVGVVEEVGLDGMVVTVDQALMVAEAVVLQDINRLTTVDLVVMVLSSLN